MNVQGIGTVFSGGRGVAALEAALRRAAPTVATEMAVGAGPACPVLAVSAEALSDPAAMRGMRRAGRLCRMAVLAAGDALGDCEMPTPAPERVGVVFATGLGPHVRTFEFLDSILDFGQAAASPTSFSHSVHNAPAAYVSQQLDRRGPALTVTDFEAAFQQAVAVAECWLAQQRCDLVLVGAGEELGQVLAHVVPRLRSVPADGRMRPFGLDCNPAPVPGEGAVFFAVTRPDGCAPYGCLTSRPERPAAALTVLDAQGLVPDESVYLDLVPTAAEVANFAPLFGTMMTGIAFQCAAAALALRYGMRYASPVRDNPHGLDVRAAAEAAPLDSVLLVSCGCSGAVTRLLLTR